MADNTTVLLQKVMEWINTGREIRFVFSSLAYMHVLRRAWVVLCVDVCINVHVKYYIVILFYEWSL